MYIKSIITASLLAAGTTLATPITYQISGRNSLTDIVFPESEPFSDFPGLTNPARFHGTITLDPDTFFFDPSIGDPNNPPSFINTKFSASIGKYTITHGDGSMFCFLIDDNSEFDFLGALGADIVYMVQTGAEGFTFDNLRLDGDDFIIEFIDPTGTAFSRDNAIEELDLTKFSAGSWSWFGYAINTENGKQNNVGIGGTFDRIKLVTVPDAGSTLGLLAFAIGGLAFFRRNLAAV